jgi:hypothetical protein
VLSYFVGSSFNLIKDNLIVVSYADTQYGHNGYIYQATHWTYTGMTDARRDKIVKGSKQHNRHISAYKSEEFDVKVRSQKHRYVFSSARKEGSLKNISNTNSCHILKAKIKDTIHHINPKYKLLYFKIQ